MNEKENLPDSCDTQTIEQIEKIFFEKYTTKFRRALMDIFRAVAGMHAALYQEKRRDELEKTGVEYIELNEIREEIIQMFMAVDNRELGKDEENLVEEAGLEKTEIETVTDTREKGEYQSRHGVDKIKRAYNISGKRDHEELDQGVPKTLIPFLKNIFQELREDELLVEMAGRIVSKRVQENPNIAEISRNLFDLNTGDRVIDIYVLGLLVSKNTDYIIGRLKAMILLWANSIITRNADVPNEGNPRVKSLIKESGFDFNIVEVIGEIIGKKDLLHTLFSDYNTLKAICRPGSLLTFLEQQTRLVDLSKYTKLFERYPDLKQNLPFIELYLFDLKFANEIREDGGMEPLKSEVDGYNENSTVDLGGLEPFIDDKMKEHKDNEIKSRKGSNVFAEFANRKRELLKQLNIEEGKLEKDPNTGKIIDEVTHQSINIIYNRVKKTQLKVDDLLKDISDKRETISDLEMPG